MQTTKMNHSVSAKRMSSASDTAAQRRGRPPKKAFINVLVRTSTRTTLTHLKAVTGLPSQGEVIDYLVSELARRRSALGQG